MIQAAFLCLLLVGRHADDFPKTPPADLPVRPVVLPKPAVKTLPNGLRIVVIQSRRVPLTTARLAMPAGAIYDPAGQPGLASATAAQLTAGTDSKTSLQIRQAAETLGGSIGVTADQDFATLSGSALAENTPAMLELMAEVLLRPAFPESELTTYKGMTDQNLVVQRQNPNFLAREQLERALYGGHPYGVVSPTAEAIHSLDAAKLKSFYQAHYLPQSAVLVIVGDVKPDDVLRKAAQLFGGWTSAAAASVVPSPSVVAPKRRILLVNRPGSVQSSILIGNPALKQGDPDSYALALANTILGGASSSRLFANVREQKGFAYGVGSAATALGLAGEFTANAETRTDVTVPAIQEMLKEMERIRKEPVTPEELQAAKNLVNGRFVSSLATQARLADRFVGQSMYHLPGDYITTYRSRISAVTAADVQRVAQKYMLPDSAVIVVVGDAGKLRDSLKAIGEVEEVK